MTATATRCAHLAVADNDHVNDNVHAHDHVLGSTWDLSLMKHSAQKS